MRAVILLIVLFTAFSSRFDSHQSGEFKLGNEVLLDNIEILKNKNVALLTNQTGILPSGTHIVDALIDKKINVVKIFSPEHGIRGDENYSNIDEKTEIPIVSLYGGKNKPSSGDLKNVDIIIYDIQDVGARFYTYTSTLYYMLESAIQNGKTVIVCDRPIIINPAYTDGFMLEPEFESFVGLVPAPVCYGMTCGELAIYLCNYVFNNTDYLKVYEMQNYSRSTDYNALNLPWVKPSPNMLSPQTAVCYPATCFLEGTNVSEGRGTAKPFEYFGAPWVNSELLAKALNSYNLSGVVFEPVTFTPSEKISSYPPKFFNKTCYGVYINVTNKSAFEPVKAGTAILIELHKNFPEFKFNKAHFIDKLAGTDKLRKSVTEGKSLSEINSLWKSSLNEFNLKREKILLYR
ncbi:MAG: DUF1343 domain-containing protein [Chlorobi bacterium]|nr:DUF1343 domain-containing protein [Chlorobiota bacterium]MCI0716034.1 DUF1343 domain-containing protein [Chlorobiota bacterium]